MAKARGARRVTRRVALPCLWLLSLIAGCAARGPAGTPAQLTDITRADELVRDGCYRCLQEADAIYARITAPPARRPPARALRGAFDTALLLAAREKELGLPADDSLRHARTRLARLSGEGAPRRTPQADDLSPLLEAAELIVGTLSGLDAEARQRRDDDTAARDAEAAARTRLQPALRARSATDLAAAYLSLAIDCEQPRNRRSMAPAAAPAPAEPPPLLRYRVAICSDGPPTALTQLRSSDPRWTDTLFFEGRFEMGSPARAADPARAAALLTPASEAFPGSVAIRLMLADALDQQGEAAAALASFDRVLASQPTHVDAWLGRVRNLSYLGRADEGMAAATTLIELGTWHVGDAYYWRAWNAYQAQRLDSAWADVQHAMRLLANTAVYALAGSIAYARRELDTAVRHFDSAFAIDPSNCLAAWSAGLVQIDRAAWPAAADRFSKAAGCFSLAARTAQTELTRLEQSELDAAVKAARVSNARKRIASADDLAAQSAFNAAQSFVHTGQKREALTYIALAATHPATRDKAAALRPRIDSMP